MKNMLDCRSALLFSKLLRKEKQNAVESFTDLKFKARVLETTCNDSVPDAESGRKVILNVRPPFLILTAHFHFISVILLASKSTKYSKTTAE